MSTFYVYIIYSKSADVYYKGFTSDPEARIQSHNDGKNEYTRSRGPWVLVYLRSFDDKSHALKEEIRLKKQNRSYLLWLIQNDPHNLIE